MNELVQKNINQEWAIKHFLRDYLDKPKDDQTLQRILEDIGEYYEADRSYIFELNAERTHTSNKIGRAHV